MSKNCYQEGDKIKELPNIEHMNLPVFRLGPTLSRLALGIPFLFASCIKQADYDLVVKQNQELESQVQSAQQQLQQEQATTKAVQARIMQLINIQSTLQKRDQELQEARSELEALRAEFDKFRTERRGAMIGKKYPHLSLDNGKLLTNAEVVSVTPTQFSIRHDGGIVKLTMEESSAKLRWEACYDPDEAKRLQRASFLADADRIEAQMERDRLNPVKKEEPKRVHTGPSAAERELRASISAQRAQLNLEFQALKSKNASAMKNVSWPSDRPETSPLFSNFGSRPIIMGMSRLESLRDGINNNLVALQQLGVRP